jgi:hypothetical protein
MFESPTLTDVTYDIIALHAVLTSFVIVGYNSKLFAKCKQSIVFFDKKHLNNVVDVTNGRIIIDAKQEQDRYFEQLKQAWN